MAAAKLHGRQNDLHRAIQAGDLAAVRGWIAAGKPLEDRDPTATTPLALAAYFDKPAMCFELLAAGASTTATDDGNHILFYAAWRGIRKLVETLIERQVDVNFQWKSGGSSGQTALIGAAKGGHTVIVKQLLAAGADATPTDNFKMTALDYAIENDDDESIAVLKAIVAPGKTARKKAAKPHPGEKIAEAGRKVIGQFAKLAERPAYRKFVDRLTKLTGKKPKAYSNPDASEYTRLKGAFLVTVPANLDVAVLAATAAKAGALLVETDQGQDPKEDSRCVLIPTRNKAAVILAMETSSNGIVAADPEDILAFLADLDASNPFRLTVCSRDTIAGEFDGPVRRAKTVAKRMLEICPDESDEDADPDSVAAFLKAERRFLLWWD